MRKYARLEGGTVREVIIQDDTWEIVKNYSPELISSGLGGTSISGFGFVECPFDILVEENWTYKNDTWTPGPPDKVPAP